MSFRPEEVSAILAQELERYEAKLETKSVGSVLSVGDGIAPLAHSLPVTFRITFRYTVMAEVAAWMPGVQRVDGLTVEYTDDDYLRAFHCARGLIVLGGVYA